MEDIKNSAIAKRGEKCNVSEQKNNNFQNSYFRKSWLKPQKKTPF